MLLNSEEEERNNELLRTLRRDARILWDISAQFVERSSGLHIRTFYEMELMPFMSSPIVDKYSAILNHPNEIAVPVKANHRKICQFSEQSRPNYHLVQATVQDLCEKALSSRKKPPETPPQKKSENDDTVVKLQWLQSPRSEILWVTGDTGCGKTTLSRFLVENLCNQVAQQQPGSETTNTRLCHFFFDDKTETQSDGLSLLTALIHQLLKSLDLETRAVVAIDLTRGFAANNSQLTMTSIHDLWEIFKSVVSAIDDGKTSQQQNIICVVDALDECEADSMSKVLKLLSSHIRDKSQTTQESSSPQGWFRIIVTSRRYQFIDNLFKSIPHIRSKLEDHTAQTARDVEKLISLRSGHIQSITSCSDSMRRTIEQRPFSGTSLVLDILERATDSSPESIERVFEGHDNLPHQLDDIYSNILQRSSDTRALLKILSVILAARRPLSLQKINTALAVRAADSSRKEVERRHQFDISRRFIGVCGQFIRISCGVVSLIHQIAKEFLIRPPLPSPAARIIQAARAIPFSASSPSPSWKYWFESSKVHRSLAEICMAYLNLLDVAHPPVSNADMDNRIEEDADRDLRPCHTDVTHHPRQESREGKQEEFFDYAARHWGIHYRFSNDPASDPIADELFAQAVTLCDTSTTTFGTWFQCYWQTISEATTLDFTFPSGMTSLMVAAQLGLQDIVAHLLSSQSVPSAFRPLASPESSNPASSVEQQRITASHGVNTQDSEGWTATHWAVWDGHSATINTATVKLLLEAGADVDLRDGKGLTALHWAAGDGQNDVIRLLLEYNAELNVNCFMERGANTNVTGEWKEEEGSCGSLVVLGGKRKVQLLEHGEGEEEVDEMEVIILD
ncbi:hypothetical protein B0H66DRAFT_534854 [Apodospora peruviana]|uniref:NACHT domain-containing protein n=1 Tax=Apodospora peruviana TaxID=516989 RepID=A0AAE0I183_9PEZI|nr:hypothetical protein B0H66DRAFT_534854 [Apodospora peruviana]